MRRQGWKANPRRRASFSSETNWRLCGFTVSVNSGRGCFVEPAWEWLGSADYLRKPAVKGAGGQKPQITVFLLIKPAG